MLALIANMLALTTAAEDNNETEATRVKRGYGGGGGGGGGTILEIKCYIINKSNPLVFFKADMDMVQDEEVELQALFTSVVILEKPKVS